MSAKKILLIDAFVNFLLGSLLLIFSDNIVSFLGVPASEQRFYPNILGAVLIGIAIALALEYYRKPHGLVGLGLGGAISINLFAGLVLAIWLFSGRLMLLIRGKIFLWALVILLVVISLYEYVVHIKKKKTK